MTKIVPTAENSIFALDIGTRTVIGIVALVESGQLRVVAQHMVEHDSRAMFDGQIHDIPKVADTVLEVKHALEKKVGFALNKAAIAAAGRALITKQCRTEMEVDENAEIDGMLVNSLEIAGIKRAYQEIDPSIPGSTEKFYCVGYSVIRYFLNSYPVTNLIGHRGKNVGADILATFLPESVVNGLYAVLGRVGLEPVHMTLEPIAAIEVLIPDSMRLLNLALIDIGAGTSDIAITKKGAVASYGMVPVAGDEITEAVAEALLVDFYWAEKIKRSLAESEEVTYQDVLGLENTIAATEVLRIIEPVLDKLTGEVAETIIDLNGGEAPRTVFCVGGGSRLPGVTDKLAEKLGLETQKVAARGRAALPNVVVEEDGLEGPDGVTVVGIATVAIKKLGQNFITIKVDGKECSLFNSKELQVANALSMLEFNPRDLIGRNGKDLKFTLNGKPEVVYGELADPAEIYVNGSKANLQSTIKDGDEIKVLKAGRGADARASLRNVVEELGLCRVMLNGQPQTIEPVCRINGELTDWAGAVKQGDNIELELLKTAGEFLSTYGEAGQVIQVNGLEVAADYLLQDGDEISGQVVVEGEENRSLSETILPVTINRKKADLKGKIQYIFLDALNHVDFEPSQNTGPPILRLNGVSAAFTDPLKEGDVIEIYWS